MPEKELPPGSLNLPRSVHALCGIPAASCRSPGCKLLTVRLLTAGRSCKADSRARMGLGWCWCLFPSSDQLRLWYYGGSLVGLILLGLVKVGLFELYNERGHPWARPMEEGHQFKDD